MIDDAKVRKTESKIKETNLEFLIVDILVVFLPKEDKRRREFSKFDVP